MLHAFLEQRLQQAVASILDDAGTTALLVRPCPDPKFGDYQTNVLMSLAKERKLNPRQLAADVLSRLNVSEWCEKVEIAGAGFLNFRLKNAAIAQTLASAARGEQLLFQRSLRPRTIVVDFSSPNVAKPMHVGHIRSTVLGDCLSRTLRLLGHVVATDNHIGDWGTQFGKLILGWKRETQADPRRFEEAISTDPIGVMERLYKTINAECETDPAVLEIARQELVKLQDGDDLNRRIWKRMVELSEKQFQELYARLGVTFDHTLGESAYNLKLGQVVQKLREAGLARESEGAIVVFFEDVPELKDHPAIIQKSDGAFNYTTTDLATLEFRLQGGVTTGTPDEIVYVTDGRQQLHFNQLFAIFRRWHPEAKVKLAHVWFGSILGDDGKPFKTRTGDTVKLADLLDEAEERAFKVVSEKNPDLPEDARRQIARVVGLGAIKYADLLPNRQSDYVFNWDKMLALQGNTAPYLQYAYARIRSIFRKSGLTENATPNALLLAAPEELNLAKHLLNFGLVIESVAAEYRPNFLCNYLYDLAGHFARFYENCPVLKAEAADRASRLALCDLTGRVLKQGLEVLGIETLEQM